MEACLALVAVQAEPPETGSWECCKIVSVLREGEDLQHTPQEAAKSVVACTYCELYATGNMQVGLKQGGLVAVIILSSIHLVPYSKYRLGTSDPSF